MVEFTPIRPRTGGLTHAILLSDGHKTLCNRVVSGWIIALGDLTCELCKERIRQPRSLK